MRGYLLKILWLGAGFLILVAFVLSRKLSDKPSEKIEYDGETYRVFNVGLKLDQLNLFWRDEAGEPFQTFEKLKNSLPSGTRLHFATNAGIFEPGQVPTGLHLENGKVLHPLNLGDGEGNFFLKPNGVFLVGVDGPEICNSDAFIEKPGIRFATQSGPMLVIDGEIHPGFLESSSHRFIRSGVGINKDGEVVFALSEQRVTFYEFAAFFRDRLNCDNALYLDGAISRFYTQNDEATKAGPFAGILAIVSE